MRLLIVSFTLLFLAGCISLKTTKSLSDLQTEFGTLVRTELECKKTPTIPETCIGDFKTMHGDIETQAVTAIEEIRNSTDLGDQQITVALYRLAAFASLKADTNNASDYGDAGSRLCASLASAAPPRDCALLTVVGQYEVAEAFANDVTCLGTAGCKAEVDGEKLANSYCANFEILDRKTESAKQQSLLPAVVVKYLDQQVSNFKKSMRSLASHYTTGLTLQNIPQQFCECVTLDPGGQDFAEKCGQLPATTRMATFKAECIRISQEETPPVCPSF